MRFNVSIVTPAEGQVVTLNELKEFAKIDGDDEDGKLDASLLAATAAAETFTRRSFLTRTLLASADCVGGRSEWFPGHFDLPVDYFDRAFPDCFELPLGPVRAITAVNTYDQYGIATLYGDANYSLINGRFTLAYQATWPSMLRPAGGVEITYTAGYGEPDDVPRPIRTAILMQAAADHDGGCCGLCDRAEVLLRPYRVMGL